MTFILHEIQKRLTLSFNFFRSCFSWWLSSLSQSITGSLGGVATEESVLILEQVLCGNIKDSRTCQNRSPQLFHLKKREKDRDDAYYLLFSIPAPKVGEL